MSEEDSKEWLTFLKKKHVDYIVQLNERGKETFEYYVTEHLRVSGIYWGLNALYIMGEEKALPSEEIHDFIMKCYHPEVGGFSGNVGHDPNILCTLSAIQVLLLLDKIDSLDVENTAKFIASHQGEDGCFTNDEWGEKDSRFCYGAVAALSLINKLELIDGKKCVEYILKCKNFDEGFGVCPDAESHAGQIFCCTGVLSILGHLDLVDKDKLGWWLCERQCKNGGLNGRPEKLADVCYSWWVLSSMQMLERLDWIDDVRLCEFMLRCQDTEDGGFSDRPGNTRDVFHTLFGTCGLSLLGRGKMYGIKPIDPVYCMPVEVLQRNKIKTLLTEITSKKEL